MDNALQQYMPHVRELVTPISHNQLGRGYMGPVSTVFPTTSRVNQVSMATGTPPSNHGIVGDYCIDGAITSSESLFADSILTELSHENVHVLFMSLTEHIREQLTYDFHPQSTSLSLESLVKHATNTNTSDGQKKHENPLIEHLLFDNDIFHRLKALVPYFESNQNSNENYYGITMDQNGECSLLLLDIMRRVIEHPQIETPHLNYIALSPSTIHHHHDHRSPQMMEYLSKMDEALKFFTENGCRFGVTSSHGTNYKLGAKGDIHIINIEKKLREYWTEYDRNSRVDILKRFQFEVILQQKLEGNIDGRGDKGVRSPVLYAFAHIHIIDNDEENNLEKNDGMHKQLKYDTLGYLRDIKGIYSSIGHEEACSSLELPPERIGDIVLLGDIDTVFGDDNIDHETFTKNAQWRLSHGGLDESTVPMLLNERPTERYLTMMGKGKGRNYHLLNVLLNGYDDNLQDQCPYQHKPSKWQYVGK